MKKVPNRSGEAQAALGRRAPVMDHRNEPRGGTTNESRDLLEEADIETIQAAAVRYDGTVYSVPPPGRHHDVFLLMTDLPPDATAIKNQGFVTSTGRFVDRREAVAIARAAAQLIREPTPHYLLTSEDVW